MHVSLPSDVWFHTPHGRVYTVMAITIDFQNAKVYIPIKHNTHNDGTGGTNLKKTERIKELKSFVKYLEDCNIFKFKVNIFNNRLKLQKYVFLARKYGFNLSYSYNLYIHGPYSPQLAEDYYTLGESAIEPEKITMEEGFIKLIKKKSDWWLELASTVVMISERYRDMGDEMMVKLVRNSKPFASESEVEEVISKLRKANTI